MPSICVCTAPETPTTHRSEFDAFIDGDIAEGGFVLTLVVVLVVLSTVLVEVD
jgi:hypothetical protein